MRSSTLALLLLISVQAVLNMGGGARGRGASQQHHVQSGSQGVQDSSAGDQNPQSSTPFPVPTTNPKLLAGIPKAAHTSGPTFYNTTPSSNSPADPKPATTDPKAFSPKLDPKHSEESPGVISVANPELRIESLDSIPTVDPRVFSKRRYRSPRVLFSAHPPDIELGEARGTGPRVRRRAGQTRHRGVYSVCDSVSNWVGNKTKAVDIKGNEVTVLPDVRINDIVKKQYFFETTCLGARRPSPTGGSSSCLGIDSRHWNSYCTNTHTFVLAMTSFKSVVAWRLIRINAACVCVLSRKSWRH